MSLESQIVVCITLYKLTAFLVGLSSLYMGYRLFASGVWGHAGEVDAAFQNNHLVIKRAAPGTFFAVLGTVIVCVTLYKGIDLDTRFRVLHQILKSSDDLALPATPPVQGELK